MSKKKATMTLKDFHGGSIPSDLPLPSAPGVIVRPSERGGFDRQAAWGNPIGRSDNHLHPGSAGMARNFDDKTPFLSHSTQIGRNFDEDERKPLDGQSGSRRTVSDESLRAFPSRVVEPKTDGRFASRPSSTPGSQYSSIAVSGSYSGRFTEVNNVGMNSQGFGSSGGPNHHNMGGSGGHMVSGPHPNAWGLRKEAAVVKEAAPPAWSSPDAALKLAHASALEKVSSGRWHSKLQSSSQTDVEIIMQPEMEIDFHFSEKDVSTKNDYNARDVVGGIEYHNTTLARKVGKSLTLDDGTDGGKEVPMYERAKTPVSMEATERSNGVQPLHHVGKPGGVELQSSAHSELTERPKLKLLPRSKPLENLEVQIEHKPVYQQPMVPVHVENPSQPRGVPNPPKSGSLGSESGHPVVERPKFNLKPRSEPSESAEVDTDSKRNTLFGGARPRELVLKERGIDNVAVNNDDLVHPPNRVKQDVMKSDRLLPHATATRYGEKHENIPIGHKAGKNPDRRDHRLEGEGMDVQRKNWRGENWRNKREFDKQHRQLQQQPQQQERPPSPDTWRKSGDHAKPASPDVQGLRYGKATSAVELAQAFSRSIRDSMSAEHFSGQKGLPGRGQPFSRLAGSTPRPQINGY